MHLSKNPLVSALVAMVTLSIAVSAALDPIEQHLRARDGTAFQQSKEATGKLANPVDLSNAKASKQAILKLVGDDLHTTGPSPSVFDDSKVAVQAQGAASTGDKAYCYLGHATAEIKRIRYEMTLQIDRDESGDTTVAAHKEVHGVVVKATSGLYSSSNPDKGSCAKTLTRHGEACANRPYIVPGTLLPHGSDASPGAAPGTASQKKPEPKPEQVYHAGPYVQRRSQVAGGADWHAADEAANLVFKRDATSDVTGAGADGASAGPGATEAAAAATKPGYKTDVTESGYVSSNDTPSGTICIDTVKRDKQVTKVVPTKAKKGHQPPGSKLHFELVHSDEKEGVWNQIIYNDQNQPIDVTHLSLSSNMSFWRAEYYCADCLPGHKKHSVIYENVEIEMDGLDGDAAPEVQCQGSAQSSSVHKRTKSQYQDKNRSGVEYKGAIFSIDRVTLGKIDGQGKGGFSSSADASVTPIAGEVPAMVAQQQKTQQQPAVKKDDAASAKDQQQQPTTGDDGAKKPNGVNKREVVEDDGPIF